MSSTAKARRRVRELGPQESVDEIFLAKEKQLRSNRNGQPYLQLQLADATGSVSAMLWNAKDEVCQSFQAGDFVRVAGSTQLYQGAVQIILQRVQRVPPEEVEANDFFPLSGQDIQGLKDRLAEILHGIQDTSLRNLATCFLEDSEFMRRLALAPAGTKQHHAYQGGLLQHTVHLLDLAGRVAPCYLFLNRDLLTMGTFLHDIGKIEELRYEGEFAYSDAGQLLGHIVLAISILDDMIRKTEERFGEPFPEATATQLKHIVISHHGEYAYGSPKLPMTLEATALHYLDSLDAKLYGFRELMESDPQVESAWTAYQPNLGRKLYKGYSGAPS